MQIKALTLDPEDIDLTTVRVVPNPYIASSTWTCGPGGRRIDFINLPDKCTIRIYSMGGNLVNVLNHIGASRRAGATTPTGRLSGQSPTSSPAMTTTAAPRPGT